MSSTCCGPEHGKGDSPAWRRVLWIALVLNASMFALEIGAGVAADSRSLQADALDFLGDAANYAISLAVVSLGLVWRARAALLKGGTIILFGLFVLGSAIWTALGKASPDPTVMGTVGLLALLINAGVALMLYRYRNGDANMRSVWICSRNDALGNVAVMLAAVGVFGTGTAWPDLIVAGIMASLALVGGYQIVRQARGELANQRPVAVVA